MENFGSSKLNMAKKRPSFDVRVGAETLATTSSSEIVQPDDRDLKQNVDDPNNSGTAQASDNDKPPAANVDENQ